MSPDDADSPFIVRAARLRAGEDARAIVAEAEAEAHRIVAEAEAEATHLREDTAARAAQDAEEALSDARARGRAEAAAEAAALLSQAASALDRFWREREDELRDVAFAVAHRILAALPRDELTVRLAEEAMAEHRRDTPLALRAPPDTAEALRAALAALGDGDRVTVTADPSLEPGGCTLLHPQGRTEVGLVAQFRSMMAGDGGRG